MSNIVIDWVTSTVLYRLMFPHGNWWIASTGVNNLVTADVYCIAPSLVTYLDG
jgi:hypothetical protein